MTTIGSLVSILTPSLYCPRFDGPVGISTENGPLENGKPKYRHSPMALSYTKRNVAVEPFHFIHRLNVRKKAGSMFGVSFPPDLSSRALAMFGRFLVSGYCFQILDPERMYGPRG